MLGLEFPHWSNGSKCTKIPKPERSPRMIKIRFLVQLMRLFQVEVWSLEPLLPRKWQQWQLFFNGTIYMTRGSTWEWDENETKAALLHWGRRGASSATVLHCILENDVPLLVHTVEAAQEKPSIANSHQHSAKQQHPDLGHRIWTVGIGSLWAFDMNKGFLSIVFHGHVIEFSTVNK